MAPVEEVTVTNHPEARRYEARIDGALAGFAAYRIHGDRIVFTHTEVDDAYEGRGVGGALARGALDDVRAGGQYKVTALCPFISAWIQRHPDYQDLLVA
jgi:predicted GNAT family acetyltransferase